ncbi:hypothetical protein U3516DRAFT_644953 [Neocallimastix sp. 'constans']
MLTDVKNKNKCNILFDNEDKYDNQIKKRKLNIKVLENNNNIMVSLPSSSPPQSPNSIQSINNIVIKTPNISRILSHLSIRTPKKIFIQTHQPSQPSSPTAASKQKQKINTIPKELFQSKFKNPKLFKNVTTPKSMKSVNLNSTPTKNLKSLNLDLTLTPSKESDNVFNSYPTSPNSSFIITTPTKVKSIPLFIENNFKNNKMSIQGISWFKNFSKEESAEEDIFKCKRMDIIPIINKKIKSNEYSYRDFDKISLSSVTDDSLSITTSISSSSSFNFLKHHTKHYNSKKNKKISSLNSKLNQTNKPTKLPLSPELSFLQLNTLCSSGKDKEEAINKFNVDSLSISSVNINKLYDNATLNQEIPISESHSTCSTSFLQSNLNGSSFGGSIDNDIFNSKDDLKMESVSEIESMADTLPISDISMSINDETNNKFIPIEDKQQEDTIIYIKLNNNYNRNNDNSDDSKNNNNNNNNHHLNLDSIYLNNKEKVNINKFDIYKGFINIDGIWEDPSLSQYEARNIKDNTLESDFELDEEIENSHNNQSLSTTPLMKFNENFSTTSTSSPNYNKDFKRSLRKSNHPLLLNMEETSSYLSSENINSLPSLNSPLKKLCNKEEHFIGINDSDLQIKPSIFYNSAIYRRSNSLNLNLLSSSFSSSSTIIDHPNIISDPFVYEKVPSWNTRKRKSLVRSNSISDISESLSGERKRSFSGLLCEEKEEEEEEEEYTSDAYSIRRSPYTQRKLNARRKAKERITKKSYHKHKNTKEKKINRNIILDTSSYILSSSSVMDYQLNKDTNKIKKNEKHDFKGKDESISSMIDQDLMSISSEILDINPDKKEKEKIKEENEENFLENDVSLLLDPTLTNLEFNKIQPKKKFENKENAPLLYNRIEESESKTITLETISSPPPILDREMIFVDEKGNVYNEQNYKYLSNYTKAVIAAELSKRYCRIPLTEILVTNMPEYRQYFDENGQLKPNNYIYVEKNEEDEDEEKEGEERGGGKRKGEGEEELEGAGEGKKKETEKRKNNYPKSNDSSININSNIKNRHRHELEENLSQQSNYFSSNINLIKKDTKTTIQFGTEPINKEKEIIFESTMSPKGKQEWLDITEASSYSTKDNFNSNFDNWNTEKQTMKDNNEGITYRNKGKYKEKEEEGENNDSDNANEEKDENGVDFVEKIDDKITIIYRTNESKYQLVMPIKLNIYNKKDTIF